MFADWDQPAKVSGPRQRHARGVLVTSILAVIVLAGSGTPSLAGEKSLSSKLDPSLIALDTPEGERLLEESKAKQSFIPLSMHFTTQANRSYCGVASACMVLNAAGIERPTSPDHDPYKLFTQRSLFTPSVRKIITPEKVRLSGMTLETLGKVLAASPVKVEVVYAEGSNLGSFRAAAVNVLKSRDSFIVVNYLRKAIRQEADGHISPIAAYHEGEDRFLIMDVARYKYPPVWVKADQLWNAMRATDSDSGKSRGYATLQPLTERAPGH